jgi:hypothetical protein
MEGFAIGVGLKLIRSIMLCPSLAAEPITTRILSRAVVDAITARKIQCLLIF